MTHHTHTTPARAHRAGRIARARARARTRARLLRRRARRFFLFIIADFYSYYFTPVRFTFVDTTRQEGGPRHE